MVQLSLQPLVGQASAVKHLSPLRPNALSFAFDQNMFWHAFHIPTNQTSTKVLLQE
jgi:hypothetical protein